jgi:putative ABC transport system permease protein
VTGWRWRLRLLAASLRERRGRVAVAGAAVAVFTAVLVTALALSLGLREQLGQELGAYGANLVVAPRATHLDARAVAALARLPGVASATAQLYVPVTLTRGVRAEAIGLEVATVAERGWRLDGVWPRAGELVLGADLAAALELAPGATIAVHLPTGRVRLRVAGVVATGRSEDRAALLDLAELQRLAGLTNLVSVALLRAPPGEVAATAARVVAAHPEVTARTLEHVAAAEAAFLAKMELLMALAALVVFAGAGLAVASTMSALVHERLAEVALLRALGGTRRDVLSVHVFEGLAIGGAGGLVGFAIGSVCALAVAAATFGRGISVPSELAPISLLIGVAMALLASLGPVLRALGRKPAMLLREG